MLSRNRWSHIKDIEELFSQYSGPKNLDSEAAQNKID